MAITPGAGYMIDPSNPNGVVKIGDINVAAPQNANTSNVTAYGGIPTAQPNGTLASAGTFTGAPAVSPNTVGPGNTPSYGAAPTYTPVATGDNSSVNLTPQGGGPGRTGESASFIPVSQFQGYTIPDGVNFTYNGQSYTRNGGYVIPISSAQAPGAANLSTYSNTPPVTPTSQGGWTGGDGHIYNADGTLASANTANLPAQTQALQDTTPTPSPYQANSADQYLQAYLQSMQPSAGVTSVQNQLATLQQSQYLSHQGLEGQPIATPFVTGQEAAVDKGLNQQQTTLTQQLAQAQSRQQSAMDVSKAALDYNQHLADQQFTAQQNALSQGATARNNAADNAAALARAQLSSSSTNSPYAALGAGGAVYNQQTGAITANNPTAAALSPYSAAGAGTTVLNKQTGELGSTTSQNIVVPNGSTAISTGGSGGTPSIVGNNPLGPASGQVPSPSGYPTATLSPGSSDTANVKKLQDYLVSQGMMTQAQVSTGYGVYGNQTKAAVAALQNKLGVPTTSADSGYFGPKTVAALGGTSAGTVPTKATSSTSTGNAKKSSETNDAFVERALSSQGLNYNTVKSAAPQGQIGVLDNKTGQVGYIPANEYNNALYTKL